MRLVQKHEIDALIQQTPDIPQNQPLLNQLYDLANALKVVRKPWMYTADFAALAAAGAQPQNFSVQVDASAPFIILSQTYSADIARAAVTVSTKVSPLVTVLMVDTGTNEQLMDRAVMVPAIFGDGQFPYVLPEPKIMAANSTLQITANNLTVGTIYNLSLTFSGYRLYSLSN